MCFIFVWLICLKEGKSSNPWKINKNFRMTVRIREKECKKENGKTGYHHPFHQNINREEFIGMKGDPLDLFALVMFAHDGKSIINHCSLSDWWSYLLINKIFYFFRFSIISSGCEGFPISFQFSLVQDSREKRIKLIEWKYNNNKILVYLILIFI